MCPSYARIRLPIAQALTRFSNWIGLPALGPPKDLKWNKINDVACEGGAWRSLVAVFIYESREWTVFADQTGYLSSISPDRWRALAGSDELIFAGYNDAVPCGELIVVRSGRVIREFLDDKQDPSNNVDRGQLAFENEAPITDWVGAASFVDSDEIVSYPESGLLWMFGKLIKPGADNKPRAST